MNKSKITIQNLPEKVVLLPIREGTKATMVKGWPDKTFEDTQTSSYQNLLEGASAIAVSLGAPSGGLCSIDFDCEEALREFLRVNPFLEDTLRTKGRRGANLWVTIYNEKIPPMTHLKDTSGEPVGEWRSDRSYTIIAGKHPNGMSYETVVNAPPLEIPFEEIKWPDGWGNLPTLAQEKPKLRTVAKVGRPITTKPKAHIQNDFDYLKEVYRIHDAWEDLGLPGEPSESCRSPFRDDVTPSFSVFDAGRKWNDFSKEEHGDVFDFVQKATGFDVLGSLLWIQGKQNQRFNFFNNNNTDEHAS